MFWFDGIQILESVMVILARRAGVERGRGGEAARFEPRGANNEPPRGARAPRCARNFGVNDTNEHTVFFLSQ